MNNVVTLSQLITRLAKTTGTDTTTARVFLRAFFSGIEQRLVAGESVTVKGIGTFRRSEDPLVGSPNGVIFIPDSELQEEVNRRFGVFQPVELADEIDETELLAPEESEELEASEELEKSEELEASEKLEEFEEPQAEEPQAEEPEAEEPEAEEPQAEEPEAEEPEAEAPQAEAPEAPQAEAPQAEEPQAEEPEAEEPEVEEPEAEEEEAPRTNHRTFFWIAGAAIVIIGAALYLAIVNNPIPKVGWDDEEELAPADTLETPLVIEEIPVESIAGQSETPAVTTPAQVTTPAPVADETVYDTVGKKNFLTTMARKYYGSHVYWVYIYEANKEKLRHPDRIPAGTRVAIPPKSSIPAINDPEEGRRLAEQKSKEIYARFK